MNWFATASPAMPSLVFIFGGLVVVCLLAKAGLDRLSLPAIVGYLLIGTLLAVVESCPVLIHGRKKNGTAHPVTARSRKNAWSQE